MRRIVCGMRWVAMLLGSALVASTARAASSGPVDVAAAGGRPAMSARFSADLGAVEVRSCPALPCTGSSTRVEIGARAKEGTKRSLETVTLAGGGEVVLATVAHPDREEMAWQAVIAPGKGVVFAGDTGPAAGAPGERRGDAIAVMEARPGVRYLVKGRVDESVGLCGEPQTLLDSHVLDPKSMSFHSASLQRVSLARRLAARPIVAVRDESPRSPTATIVSPAGSSSRAPASLAIDGRPETLWTESRTGFGKGEFFTLATDKDIPISAVVVRMPGPKRPKAFAAPRVFFLSTDSSVYAITMPEDGAMHPEASYTVRWPKPIRTSCLSVVLDEPYAKPRTHPEVGLSHLAVLTQFDTEGKSLTDLAAELSGRRARAAFAVLKRAGPKAAEAVGKHFDRYDAGARALATDVAISAGDCSTSAPVLIRAMVDSDREVSRKGEEKVMRCGRAVRPALIKAIGAPGKGASSGEKLAKLAWAISMLDPSATPEVLAAHLAVDDAETRAALRRSIAYAWKRREWEKLGELLTKEELSLAVRLELLRAARGGLNHAPHEAQTVVARLLTDDADFKTRYLAVEPLAEIAKYGSEGSDRVWAANRLIRLARHDDRWPVRARAVLLSATIDAAKVAVVSALSDPSPRVRLAALEALAKTSRTEAAVPVTQRLESDPWTFVRVAAAKALSSMPAAPDIDAALRKAATDKSLLVRLEVVRALGQHRDARAADSLIAMLESEDESAELRIAAAEALVKMCDFRAAEPLTELVPLALNSTRDRESLGLGLAAVRALGALHPRDLQRRLAPLTAKGVRPEVRMVVKRALASKGACAR